MKARDAIGRKTAQEDRKTAQEERHGIACKGPGITRPAFLTSASFGGIAVLLFLGGSISVCSRGFGTGADSVQITLGRGTSSTSARTAPRERFWLEGVQFKPDDSGLRPNSQPILDSAVELLKSHPDMKVYVDTYCDPTGGKRLNLSSVAAARCDRVRLP